MVWRLVCAFCRPSLTHYGVNCFLISHSLRLAFSRAGPCLVVGFLFLSQFFAFFVILPSLSAILFLLFLPWCYLTHVCWASLGLLLILLIMTQYGNWFYTHTTLGFSWPISLLVGSFVPFLSPWASLTHFLILHTHKLLLTHLGFPGLITLFFTLGAHKLPINPLLSYFITSGLLWPIFTLLHHIMPMGLLSLSSGSFSPVYFPQGPLVFFMGVDAHFCESISKSPWGRKPNKNQGPKAHQEDRRERKVQRKNTNLPQIYSKTQICSKLQICSRIQIYRRIQFFNRMTSADKDKFGPRPYWSSQYYLAHKGLNPL